MYQLITVYLSYFWEHLVVTLQHIPVVSWVGFLIVFWVVVLIRALNNEYKYKAIDTDMIDPGLTLNFFVYICFQLLVAEQQYSV